MENKPSHGGPAEREIFLAALERATPLERAAFLDGACVGNPQLRAAVEALLAHHAEDNFLEEPAEGPAGTLKSNNPARPVTEAPGDYIDRYKLLQKIGEGGCGVVYMADQEEPIRRRVALKVIKPGMDTRAVIARFEAERQALAMMDHPNIAKVLDVGQTATGRPFFVMELVKGVRITEYCDQNNLPTRERLALFTQVCHAIQHAHQKGIIHRDIKPSNILVTLHDGVPVPKVIDFGIAKALHQQRLTDLTLFTAFGQFMGTPAYMSPEQAELSGLDIDTRCDIYALGVLLYELLVGQVPFDGQQLLQAGLDEMRRIIREQEPVRPSAHLSTLAAADLTVVARHRQCEPGKLTHLVRGDLDWIVMKCLEKDRTRRYETSSGLAADIQRHLDNEAVTARPASNLYRFQKTVRRNKLAFAAAGAVAAALVIGLAVSSWLFFKESKARQRAETAEKGQARLRKKAEAEAQKSHQIARFLEDMLKGVRPSVALGRDTIMLREIVDKAAVRLSRDLKSQPLVEADLRHLFGGVYVDLGEYAKAEVMVREALAMKTKLLGNEHVDVADSLGNLAVILEEQGKLTEAEAMHRETLAMRKKLLGNEHPDVVGSLHNLAGVLSAQGKLMEAETINREVLAKRKKLLGNEHPDVAQSLNNLAAVLEEQGKLLEAEAMYREALTMKKKLLGNEHPDVAGSLNNLANVLHSQNKLTEAETVHREALAMWKKLLSNEHPHVATSLHNLAEVLKDQGKLIEAEQMHREALAMWKKLLGDEHPEVVRSLCNLAVVLEKQDKLTEAETMIREALALEKKRIGNEHPDVARSLHNLALVLHRQGKLTEAETMHREALTMRKKLLGNEHLAVAESLGNLALVLAGQSNLVEAETMLREALTMRKKLLSHEHPDVAAALNNLATVLVMQGRLDEVEPLLLEKNKIWQQSNQVTAKDKRAGIELLVNFYFAWADAAPGTGKMQKALEWREKLIEFDKATQEQKPGVKQP